MTPRLGEGEGVVSEKSEEQEGEGERESTFQTGHGSLELRHLLQVCRVSLLLFVHQSL